MKKVYVKPEMVMDEFDLTQTIATGCNTIPQPGEVVVESCCKPNSDEYFNSGSAHPYIEKYLEDTNGNGKIDKSEFDAAVAECEKAFAAIGEGHSNVHSTQVHYNGGPIPTDLFSS